MRLSTSSIVSPAPTLSASNLVHIRGNPLASFSLSSPRQMRKFAFSCNCCKIVHLDSRSPEAVKYGNFKTILRLHGGSLTLNVKGYRMRNSKGKWLLAVVALRCLAPAAFAQCPASARCVSAPEGGSAAIYLLGAGLTCFGAMLLRHMLAKRTQS